MVDKDNKIHKEAMERFDKAFAFDRHEREKCQQDIRFVYDDDGQWDDHAKEARKNRPMYTVDKVSPAINQIIGEYTQSRVTIKVRPSQGGSDDIANTYNGLIRNINSVSKAQHAYDTAFKNITTSGFGAWRIATELNDDTAFDDNQDILIKPITSPSTDVWVDPNSKDPNGRDATYIFVISEMSKESFEDKYPDAIASDFDNNLLTINGNTCHSGWANIDTVRVAEYWVKEKIDAEIVLLSDQTVITGEKFEIIGDELAKKGITEVKRRKIKKSKVTFYRVSGSEILEGPKEWAGKHIPIVLTYGYNGWVGNKHHYRGIVRKAIDPQRIYNYTVSSIIEATALAPKDPWLVTPLMLAGHVSKWKKINTENSPFLFYNADPAAPSGGPKREGPPALQQSLIIQSQQAEADIRATTGLFAPSLGDSPDAQSGKAILAQQRQGDRGSMELFDNLAKGIEYSGEILVDLIPLIYDGTRQIRILNEDGSTDMVQINETIPDEQTGKNILINDLSEGKYDLTISSGPDFITKRVEAVNIISKLAATNESFAAVSIDLLAENLDFPFGKELTTRVRKQQLGLPFMEPNEEEAAQLQEAQQAALEAEQANSELNNKLVVVQLTAADLANEELAAKIDGMEIDNEGKRVDIEKTRAGIEKTLVDAAATKVKANLPISPGEIEARESNIELLNAQLDISEIALSQEAAAINPEGLKPERQEVTPSQQDVTPSQPPVDKVLIQDPESGLLVNPETQEIFDPETGEQLQ